MEDLSTLCWGVLTTILGVRINPVHDNSAIGAGLHPHPLAGLHPHPLAKTFGLKLIRFEQNQDLASLKHSISHGYTYENQTRTSYIRHRAC